MIVSTPRRSIGEADETKEGRGEGGGGSYSHWFWLYWTFMYLETKVGYPVGAPVWYQPSWSTRDRKARNNPKCISYKDAIRGMTERETGGPGSLLLTSVQTNHNQGRLSFGATVLLLTAQSSVSKQ